ncbi:MAG: MBL fold metallo-hydrolase [Marinobacter sp.]|uniref:MBL fold metallo-hydrolase RNA specificity domain-containing protein n=1 Tax=Marinobacter sp. TaxID=50741 RepID=UPI0034A01DE1
MIDIKHHGATSGVTGSCHELLVGESGILIDCGLFQGEEESNGAGANSLSVDFPISHICALVVTHVHIDHVGRIPYLLAAGFEGPIICSEPSAVMLPEILEDALKIGFTRDRALIERVLGLIRSRLVPVPYDQWHSVFSHSDADKGEVSLSVRLQRAGHILGSAYVECEARSGEALERIVFSGDLGAPHAPLLPEPKPPERCDRLVIESTYGDKDHENRETRRLRLKAILEHALDDGGTVLIPAFSIGRTQELLYEIEGLIHEFGEAEPLDWSRLEIVVDSPLAANFTGIYDRLKHFWDAEALERVQQGRHPLSFDQLTVIDDHKDHLNAVDYLARTHRPCVVLAGSGMCAGGRVVNYLKAMLAEPRNDVLFVGYQAAGTPGRDILRYGPRGGWVTLDNRRYDIRARVHQVGGYSAHAGQSDLVRFVTGMAGVPAEIRIVHGDANAKQTLKECFNQTVSARVLIP